MLRSCLDAACNGLIDGNMLDAILVLTLADLFGCRCYSYGLSEDPANVL